MPSPRHKSSPIKCCKVNTVVLLLNINIFIIKIRVMLLRFPNTNYIFIMLYNENVQSVLFLIIAHLKTTSYLKIFCLLNSQNTSLRIFFLKIIYNNELNKIYFKNILFICYTLTYSYCI